MSEKSILDTIVINSPEKIEVKGIIDFVSPNFIHFFDMSSDETGDLMMLIVKWRVSDHSHLRFSVFCAMFYPHSYIPNIILLNVKQIDLYPSDVPNIQQEKIRRKKFLLRTQSD
jgi:hypothetical protein